MSMRPPTAPMTQPQAAVNPLHTTFHNPTWPANWITAENVLEYFCNPSNCFYDASSCNQQIKMQNIVRPLEECLLSMTGIQYVLWSAQPPLYVICKHRRNSPQNVTPMAYYYIINGVVHQCPDMHAFVQSRLLAAVEPLKKAFDEAVQCSRYNVAKGYYWQFKDKPAVKDDEKEKEDDKPLQARSSHFQQTRTNMLMKNLLEAFPACDGLTIDPAPSESQATMDDDAQSSKGSVAPPPTAEPTTSMNPPLKKPKSEVPNR